MASHPNKYRNKTAPINDTLPQNGIETRQRKRASTLKSVTKALGKKVPRPLRRNAAKAALREK